MRITITTVLICLLAPFVAAQPAQPAKVDDLTPILKEVLASNSDIPAFAAAVVRGDQIIAQGVSGVRRRGSPEPVTLDDKFHLGSDTKAMTATMIGTLVEEGKLKWSSTLEDVFPKQAPKMLPEYRKVTLEQLLTHHAGVPTSGDVGNWHKESRHFTDMFKARDFILAAITTNPPEAPPGDRYIYSNGGYVIAGHMAEQVTGKTWEELMQTRLFDPLKMTTAGFGAPGAKGKPDEPRGHGASGPVEPGPGADNPLAMGPAGTVHCTLADWAKFISLHLQAARGNPKILKAATFAKLHTPVKPKSAEEKPYAMGWVVVERKWAGGAAFNHSGSNTLWFCNVWIAPKRNLAFLVMCNQGPTPAREATEEILTQLIKRYAP
jgi:CubicO group peptidase (beta-lactamase class C family)